MPFHPMGSECRTEKESFMNQMRISMRRGVALQAFACEAHWTPARETDQYRLASLNRPGCEFPALSMHSQRFSRTIGCGMKGAE